MLSNKKGISGIVSTVLMIALVLVAVGVVWGFVSNLLEDQTEKASSCFEIMGKIELNDQYTCVDGDDLKFSISVGDVEIEDILVVVSSADESKSFKLGDGDSWLTYSSGDPPVEAPSKNSGKTYLIELGSFGISNPESISVIPIVDGNTCEKADSINSIPDCRAFE